jgi:hypothetical protein
MAEQPVNLSTVIYLGVFSRAEQRVLQAIFKAIAEDNGRCVATLAMLARDSNTSRSTTRNAISRAISIGLLEKTERRSQCAVSLPNILTYAKPAKIDKRAAQVDCNISNVRKHQRFSEIHLTSPALGRGRGTVTEHSHPI